MPKLHFEHSVDATIGILPDGIIVDLNAAALLLFGISRSAMGQPISEALGERFVLIEEFLSLEEVHEEIVLQDQNNQTHYLALWMLPLDDYERLGGRLLIFHDMTPWREFVQNKLSGQENRFRALIENSLDVVGLVDAQANVLYESPAITSVLGYDVDELIGRSGFDLVHPDDRSRAVSYIGGMVNQAGAVFKLDLRILHKDGSYRLCELVGRNLLADPNVQAIVINYRDITERRLAEAQAAELTAKRAQVTMLMDFVRDVSHDFRSALSVIGVNVELLEHVATAEKTHRNLENIRLGTGVLEILLQHMLLMVKLDSGVTPERISTQVNTLVNQVCAQSEAAARLKRIRIVRQVGEKLPSTRLDVDMFEQLLKEVLENAIAYSLEGGTITVRTYVQDECIGIDILDTGAGIPESDLPHIFERLYRVDKARSGLTGHVGLGLTIARKIVELHGGTLRVQSHLGEGSLFEIMLPISQEG